MAVAWYATYFREASVVSMAYKGVNIFPVIAVQAFKDLGFQIEVAESMSHVEQLIS